MDEFFDILARSLELSQDDLRGWVAAWARLAPSLLMIPAFGLRAVPAPTRAALGLALAASAAPASQPVASQLPLAALIVTNILQGLPVALATSVALWVATMAGAIGDYFIGLRAPSGLPNVDAGATPLGTLLSMLAAIAFLQSGGPARLAAHLAQPQLAVLEPLERAVVALAQGIELAVLIAAPLVVIAIAVNVAAALMVRAANPAYLSPIIAPLRALVLIGAVGVVLGEVAELAMANAARVP